MMKSEDECVDKVFCGHNKWMIGIDKNAYVIVEWSRHPSHGSVQLADISIEEMHALGEMFTNAAKKAQEYNDSIVKKP